MVFGHAVGDRDWRDVEQAHGEGIAVPYLKQELVRPCPVHALYPYRFHASNTAAPAGAIFGEHFQLLLCVHVTKVNGELVNNQ